MNNQQAIYFAGTNAFSLIAFGTNWSAGEIFAVVKSFGDTNNTVGIWRMGDDDFDVCLYPNSNGQIQDTFGRKAASLLTGYPGSLIRSPHLYNVTSTSSKWANRLNNTPFFSTTTNTVGFARIPQLGRSGTSDYFRGYMSEIMIFDRELTSAERDALATNYFHQRFGL
jgi:hypothetical protein